MLGHSLCTRTSVRLGVASSFLLEGWDALYDAGYRAVCGAAFHHHRRLARPLRRLLQLPFLRLRQQQRPE